MVVLVLLLLVEARRKKDLSFMSSPTKMKRQNETPAKNRNSHGVAVGRIALAVVTMTAQH